MERSERGKPDVEILGLDQRRFRLADKRYRLYAYVARDI